VKENHEEIVPLFKEEVLGGEKSVMKMAVSGLVVGVVENVSVKQIFDQIRREESNYKGGQDFSEQLGGGPGDEGQAYCHQAESKASDLGQMKDPRIVSRDVLPHRLPELLHVLGLDRLILVRLGGTFVAHVL